MKRKTIKIPIYFGTLVIYKGNNWRKIEKKYNLKSTKGCLGFAFSLDEKNKPSQFIVCVPKKYDAGVVAHEALHLTNFILKERGINADYDNDEAQAYLIGWIVTEIYKFLK